MLESGLLPWGCCEREDGQDPRAQQLWRETGREMDPVYFDTAFSGPVVGQARRRNDLIKLSSQVHRQILRLLSESRETEAQGALTSLVGPRCLGEGSLARRSLSWRVDAVLDTSPWP